MSTGVRRICCFIYGRDLSYFDMHFSKGSSETYEEPTKKLALIFSAPEPQNSHILHENGGNQGKGHFSRELLGGRTDGSPSVDMIYQVLKDL